MKKLMIALVAGMFTVSGAYAGEMTKDSKKSESGMTKSEKGMDKKGEAMSKDDDKKKTKKKDEMTK